uniref:Hexosyltransferase n=1 Tax=Setaria digitata TaxID=48799 RepID=A0A915PYE8_9BILA
MFSLIIALWILNSSRNETALIYKNGIIQGVVSVDPYQYGWTILEETFCSVLHPNLTIIIIIHSASDHFKQRVLLRQMYGERFYKQYGIATLFAVGLAKDSKMQGQLIEESRRERDLIQQNFLDSYRNLTWKVELPYASAMMWLRFVDEYCPNVQYIMKLDDDVVGNILQVLRFLNERVEAVNLLESQKRIFCRVIYNRPVSREKTNKWYVTKDELPSEYYSNYCVGMAIVFTGDLPRILLRAAAAERYFWIDDYFVTGILAKKAEAHLVDLKRKIVVYGWEGSEEGLVNGDIFFRLIPDMSYGIQLWRQIELRHSMRSSDRPTQLAILPWHHRTK